MPAKLLVDLSEIDLNQVEVPLEGIRRLNPQRFEMEQLTGIIKFDRDRGFIVGFKDVAHDEFWIRGHIPGRPLMPGVLILESAAQLCTYYYKAALGDDPARFLGFGGVDKVRFRGPVLPGDRLILIAKNIGLKSRLASFETQGVVNGRIVYEGIIIGMMMGSVRSERLDGSLQS